MATRRQKNTEFTPARAQVFLAALRVGNTVTASADKAGTSRQTVYAHRNTDSAFALAWDAAEQEGTDRLEQEAKRRAYDGWLEPVYQQGKKIGTVRKYSDALLQTLLKARNPAKFRENSRVEHSGSVAVQHRVDLARLNDDELAELQRLVEQAAVEGGDSAGTGPA